MAGCSRKVFGGIGRESRIENCADFLVATSAFWDFSKDEVKVL